jgi:DNA-directed RNA polymerase specialized sigma24 family protein
VNASRPACPGWWAACGRHGTPVALLASITGQADPVDHAVAAGQLLSGLAAATAQAAEVRRAAVAELRNAGWSHADVATALGLSRGQAQSLAAGRSHSGTRQPA